MIQDLCEQNPGRNQGQMYMDFVSPYAHLAWAIWSGNPPHFWPARPFAPKDWKPEDTVVNLQP